MPKDIPVNNGSFFSQLIIFLNNILETDVCLKNEVSLHIPKPKINLSVKNRKSWWL